MSLSEVIAGLKHSVNSTIGTENFTPLDQIVKSQTLDLSSVADKSTLDALSSTIGQTSNTGGGYQQGTVNAKLNALINTLSTVNTNVDSIKTTTGTINTNVNTINTNVNTIKSTVDTIKTNVDKASSYAESASGNAYIAAFNIGVTTDVGGSPASGTIMGKLNAIINYSGDIQNKVNNDIVNSGYLKVREQGSRIMHKIVKPNSSMRLGLEGASDSHCIADINNIIDSDKTFKTTKTIIYNVEAFAYYMDGTTAKKCDTIVSGYTSTTLQRPYFQIVIDNVGYYSTILNRSYEVIIAYNYVTYY